MLDVGSPERGDTMVFRYPLDPSVDYVKRVVGAARRQSHHKRQQVHHQRQDVPLEPAGEFYDAEQGK